MPVYLPQTKQTKKQPATQWIVIYKAMSIDSLTMLDGQTGK